MTARHQRADTRDIAALLAAADTQGRVDQMAFEAERLILRSQRVGGVDAAALVNDLQRSDSLDHYKRDSFLDAIDHRLETPSEKSRFLSNSRHGSKKAPNPLRAEQRRLLVNQSGTLLAKSTIDTAWQRMIKMAMTENVITAAQRFSLHGLKRRGVTDTQGNIADKQDAAGHVERRMTQRYNHELPVVPPPRPRRK